MQPIKFIYGEEGFVFRNDQNELCKLLGINKYQLISIMDSGIGQDEVMEYEDAHTLVGWFKEKGYTLLNKPPEKVIAKDVDKAGEILSERYHFSGSNQFLFKRILGFDESTNYGSFEVEEVAVRERNTFYFQLIK